jgi:hypothetical protein
MLHAKRDAERVGNYLRQAEFDKKEMQAKYERIFSRFEPTISDLKQQLAQSQNHFRMLQASSTNQHEYGERLAAVKKETEHAVTIRLQAHFRDVQQKLEDDHKTKIAAFQNQQDEDKHKMAALEEQLRTANEGNEQHKQQAQQQLQKQIQQQTAKREFDEQVLSDSMRNQNSMLSQQSSTAAPMVAPTAAPVVAPNAAPTAPLDAPNKRRMIDTTGRVDYTLPCVHD